MDWKCTVSRQGPLVGELGNHSTAIDLWLIPNSIPVVPVTPLHPDLNQSPSTCDIRRDANRLIFILEV